MRAPRVPVEEQYRLIMECRKSGLSDHQWCLNNDINPGTFYNWVKRLRKNSFGDESAYFKRNGSTASCQNNPDTCGAFMLGDITAAGELYIVTGYTDMRKSIDGLCAIVEDQLHMDPRRSALYLFCGKRCDRVKALLWENGGFVLLYKCMEVKGRFRWPRSSQEVRQLTWQ